MIFKNKFHELVKVIKWHIFSYFKFSHELTISKFRLPPNHCSIMKLKAPAFRNILITSFVSLVIISQIISLPPIIKIPLLFTNGLINGTVVYLIYKYYKSLPESKCSILTYLMQLFMILGMVSIIWYTAAEILIELPSLIQPAMTAYPNVMCSLCIMNFLPFQSASVCCL